MSSGLLAPAHRLLTEALDALGAAADPAAGDSEMLSVPTVCEGTTRRLDLIAVRTIAALQRRGVFTDRGYKNPVGALADLLGCEWADARRRVLGAEQVCERVGLDGAVLPARLPATAAMFEDGRIGLRHIEVITKVLGTDAAGRLTAAVWAEVETILAAQATEVGPSQLLSIGTGMVDALDADGAEPHDRPAPRVNELHVRRHRGAPGGRITGRIDDAAMFDAIATAIDAHAAPLTGDDQRTAPQRQAEALADICAQVLVHGEMPERGGRRPHMNVIIRQKIWSSGPAPPCSTSAAPCRRSRCGCSPATPPLSRS